MIWKLDSIPSIILTTPLCFPSFRHWWRRSHGRNWGRWAGHRHVATDLLSGSILCEDFAGWLKDIQSGELRYMWEAIYGAVLPSTERWDFRGCHRTLLLAAGWWRRRFSGPVSLLPAEAPSYANWGSNMRGKTLYVGQRSQIAVLELKLKKPHSSCWHIEILFGIILS
jgi:hypothetical protein